MEEEKKEVEQTTSEPIQNEVAPENTVAPAPVEPATANFRGRKPRRANPAGYAGGFLHGIVKQGTVNTFFSGELQLDHQKDSRRRARGSPGGLCRGFGLCPFSAEKTAAAQPV